VWRGTLHTFRSVNCTWPLLTLYATCQLRMPSRVVPALAQRLGGCMPAGRVSIDKRVSRWQVLVKVTDYGQALLGAGGSRGVTTNSGKPPDS